MVLPYPIASFKTGERKRYRMSNAQSYMAMINLKDSGKRTPYFKRIFKILTRPPDGITEPLANALNLTKTGNS